MKCPGDLRLKRWVGGLFSCPEIEHHILVFSSSCPVHRPFVEDEPPGFGKYFTRDARITQLFIIMTQNLKILRDPFWDIIKGLGIILVVLGHFLQSRQSNVDDNLCYRAIYSFHMPLFFFVSGYLSFRSLISGGFLAKRFMGLVIPFLAWYFVLGWAEGTIHELGIAAFALRLVLHPDWGLWFLWILFSCYLVLYPVSWIGNSPSSRWLVTGTGILVFFGVRFFPSDNFGLPLLRLNLLFFLAGFLGHLWNLGSYGALKRFVPDICIIGFFLLVPFWRRVGPYPFEPYLRLYFPGGAGLMIEIFNYIVAFCGIGALSEFAAAVSAKAYSGALLGFLGRSSFEIYAVHFKVLALVSATRFFSGGVELIEVIIGVAAVIAISLLISHVLLRRARLLNLLFLGSRQIPARS
ncbi:MAG TPA: acyltransferase family protein [Lacunisphaera sp.]